MKIGKRRPIRMKAEKKMWIVKSVLDPDNAINFDNLPTIKIGKFDNSRWYRLFIYDALRYPKG